MMPLGLFWALCTLAPAAVNHTPPPPPSPLSLSPSPAQRIQQQLDAAIRAGRSGFVLPEGDLNMSSHILRLADANGFTLAGAAGSSTQLWFAPGGGLVVANSSNSTVRDLTIAYGGPAGSAAVAQLAIRRVISTQSSRCPKVGDKDYDPCVANTPTPLCNATYELELHPDSHPIEGLVSATVVEKGFPGLRDCARTRSQVWNDGMLVGPPEGWLHTQCHAPRPVHGFLPTQGVGVGPGGGRLLIANMQPVYGARVGTRITYYGREYLTYVVANSSRITTQDVTIHQATGFAITELDGECGHTYRRVRLIRRPGPDPLLIASNADAFHSSDCAQGPLLEECELSNMMDDYINIHNSLFSVVSVDASKRQLRLSMARPRFFVGGAGCNRQWLMSERDVYDPGTDPMQNVVPSDTLSCHHRDATISLWARLTVKSVEADKQPNASLLPSTFTVTTSDALPTAATKDVSCWIDRLSAHGAVLRNNSFHHGLPGAGVRWKSSGGRIEHNTWTDSVQTHIEIAPYSSVEGPLVISNVTIAENRWINSSWWRVSTEEGWQPPCATAKAGTSGIHCAGIKTDDDIDAAPAEVRATCVNKLDCTSELQHALDSGAQRVIVPFLGRPWLIQPISLRSNQIVTLESHVELLAKSDAFHSKGASLVTAHSAVNVTFEGGFNSTLRMRQADYLNKTAGVSYSWSWDRHGMDIVNVQGLVVRSIIITETGGNVMSIGNESPMRTRDVTITNCTLDQGFSQGLSIYGGTNIRVEDTLISNCNGTDPVDAIDIEPGTDKQELANIRISRVHAVNNSGWAFSMYLLECGVACGGKPIDVAFEDCSVSGGGGGFLFDAFEPEIQGHITVRGGIVSDVDTNGLLVMNKAGTSATVDISELALKHTGRYRVLGQPCMPPHCPTSHGVEYPPGDPKKEYPPGARAVAVGIYYRESYSHAAQGGLILRNITVMETGQVRPWLQAIGTPACGPKCRTFGLANISASATVQLDQSASEHACKANLSQPQAAVHVKSKCVRGQPTPVGQRLSFSKPSLVTWTHMRAEPGFWSIDGEFVLGVAGGVMPNKTSAYFFSPNGGSHWTRPWPLNNSLPFRNPARKTFAQSIELYRDHGGTLHDLGDASAAGSATVLQSDFVNTFAVRSGVLHHATVNRSVSLELPVLVPKSCHVVWGENGAVRLPNGTHIKTVVVQGSTPARTMEVLPDTGIFALRSDDGGYHWRAVGVVANNSNVVTHEGANENDLTITKSGALLCILRVDAGDGEGCAKCDSASSGCRGPCQPYHRSISTDLGVTWSVPTALPFTSNTDAPIGSVRPRLASLGPPDAPAALLLTGGRNCVQNGMRCGLPALPALWPLAEAIRDGKCTGACPMTVLCPPGCGTNHGRVFGVGPFALESDVCAAAISAGAVNSSGGWVKLQPTSHPLRVDFNFAAGVRNGVRSYARGLFDGADRRARGYGLLISAAYGPSSCEKLWANFGEVNFKTLGMKLWVSWDGEGEVWEEHDLSYEHNQQIEDSQLLFDERVNASVYGHSGWATQSYFSLDRLSPTSAVIVYGGCLAADGDQPRCPYDPNGTAFSMKIGVSGLKLDDSEATASTLP